MSKFMKIGAFILCLLTATASSEVTILNVEDGATVRANGGTIQFWVSADEPYKILWNGDILVESKATVAKGKYPNTVEVVIENVSRGEHELLIQTLECGKLTTTQTITFTVQRVSRLL